jgi:hypothetical protein
MGQTKKKSSRTADRMVTFEITTFRPLPVGQQVFISGNIDVLGHWKADGFPLTRLDDNLWSGYAVVPDNTPVEFKITRGTWTSEEAESNRIARKENLTLPARGTTTFKHIVNGWIDRA